MPSVTLVSRGELLAQREQQLRVAGLPEHELRERAASYNLTTAQMDALDRIDDIDFLLAGDE